MARGGFFPRARCGLFRRAMRVMATEVFLSLAGGAPSLSLQEPVSMAGRLCGYHCRASGAGVRGCSVAWRVGPGERPCEQGEAGGSGVPARRRPAGGEVPVAAMEDSIAFLF
ncbi:hypothetical protein VPH35_056946 [Triticum aestivum]